MKQMRKPKRAGRGDGARSAAPGPATANPPAPTPRGALPAPTGGMVEPEDRRLAAEREPGSDEQLAQYLDRGAVRDAAAVGVPGHVLAHMQAAYFRSSAPGGLDTSRAHAIAQMRDAVERMRPRDPVEEMLVHQLVLTHCRILHLSSKANFQEGCKQLATISQALEAAHNTYRRLAMALDELRRPRRTEVTVVKQQYNRAEQQVVQNNGGAGGFDGAENDRNEKGSA